MTRILDVYLHEKKAGRLIQDDDAVLSFAYTPEYLADGAHPTMQDQLDMGRDFMKKYRDTFKILAR